ncbi:O-antigen ligase family protein [Candidatus Shapirobacteria bacterium]|nr:O-antigen ligase family protein [Candidatus Shapirobacteria bacterium]
MNLSKTFLFLILIIFPLGQLVRLPLGWLMVNIYLQDLFVLGLAVSFLKREGLKGLRVSKLFQSFRPFLIISVLSLAINIPVWGGRNTLTGSLYLVRYLAYFFIFLTVEGFNQGEKKQVLKMLFLSGWLAAVLGLIQYFIYPDFRSWELFNWDPHLYRVVGTFWDPGFTGMIYLQALVLIVILNWSKIKNINWRFFSFWVLPIYLALVLTYSRSVYLALLIAIGVIAWFKKTKKFFLVGSGILLVTIIFLPRLSSIGTKIERRDSVYSRLENWRHSLTIVRQNPLLGVGFNNYRWAQKEAGFLEDDWEKNHAGAGADSSILFILATTGIFGLIAYLLFFKELLRGSGLLILATFIPWLIHSFFNNSLFYPWLIIWGWIVLGAVSDR